MVTIETYIANTISLVRSLTIKSNDVAIHMNNELIKIYGTSILGNNANDKSGWKYYMNLCGEYHVIDNPIKITVIETGTVKELSKELLTQYPTTLQELLKHEDYYTDLIDTYPNDELLIKGIMYGLDMDYVTNIPDGTIVAHSQYFLEEQESNLMNELSDYSVNFFKRWHIKEYGLIDNLYLPSLLSTLYSKLVLKVLNIRYSNIYTSNIHSFHMYEFFRSHFDIDVSVLNKSTKFWLYKNMRYIRKHIGSNETINIIIEKILTNNGIGIAEIELINSLPDIELLDLDDVTQSLYDKKTNSFVSKPRNDYYLNSDSDNNTSSQMILAQFNRKLVDNDLIIRDTSEVDAKYVPKLDPNILHRQKTKTFKLKINKSHVVTQDVSMKLLLDNWVYLVETDKFRTIKKYIDANTGITYNLSPKQGLLMVFKLIAKIRGIDNPILKGYTATNLINENATYETLTKNIIKDDVLEVIVNKLLARTPVNHTYIGDDKFNAYISDVTTFNSLIWNITSNTNDMLLNSDLQVIYNRFHKKEYIDFGEDKTVDEMISETSMYYTIDYDYDYMLVIKELFELFTGYKIGEEDIELELDKYINITKKLTSYTIQFITDKNELDIIPLRYHGIESMNTGVADIKESTFRALEEFYGYLEATAIPFLGYMDGDDGIIDLRNKTNPNPPTIIMYDLKSSLLNTLVSNDRPVLIAHVDSDLHMFNPDIDVGHNTNKVSNVIDNIVDIPVTGIKADSSLELMITDPSDDSGKNLNLISIANKIGVDLFTPKIEGEDYTVGESKGFNSELFINKYNASDKNLDLEVTNYNLDDIPVVINKGKVSIEQEYFIKEKDE